MKTQNQPQAVRAQAPTIPSLADFEIARAIRDASEQGAANIVAQMNQRHGALIGAVRCLTVMRVNPDGTVVIGPQGWRILKDAMEDCNEV